MKTNYKKVYKKQKKGGKGNYTEKYLNSPSNVIEVDENGEKVKYVKDEDGSILDDFIGPVRLDRAILVNGRIYDIENIFNWVTISKKTTDPIDREDITNDIERIKNQYIKIFGEEEYNKHIKNINAPPPRKPVAYDQYGNMVDQYPNPQYFVDANGETFFEYNVNRSGQPILANGELIYIPRPANNNRPLAVPVRRVTPPRRTSPARRYILHFDRPGNGFLVDNHNNPSNFVTVDGDILGPYLLDANYFPIDEFGENVFVVRRNQLDRSIIQNSTIHTARFSPRTRQQSNALAGISPPASPRPSPPRRNASPVISSVTRRRGRPAPRNSRSPPAARPPSPPGARRGSPPAARPPSPQGARRGSPPAARRSTSPPAATNPPAPTRRRGRPRRQPNP